ncbi:MAG: universal stress protein [Candidatus Melainabacteria bacterium]|nr:MAG: universal stress protein [Candidatus Melainabacteria bacterium]
MNTATLGLLATNPEAKMKVLIAVEDKEFGETIIDYIKKNNWNTDTKFKILHVIEPYELDEGVDVTYLPFLEDTKEQARAAAKTLVNSLTIKLKDKFVNCSIESDVAEGNPKEILLKEIEKWSADLLCLGTHGRRGVSKFLLGSVSQALASHAPCAVLIVKKST